MKKAIALSAVCFIAILLTGCGRQPTIQNQQTTPLSQQQVQDLNKAATRKESPMPATSSPATSTSTDGHATCTDSDGGKNIYVRGDTITEENGKILMPLGDSCIIKHQSGAIEPIKSCSGATCFLKESYCYHQDGWGEIGGSEYVTCKAGCDGGACISE